MDWLDALVVVLAGFAAGFINTLAGGGSLIALSALIFMGLPPAVANATNRVAVFSQNVFGVLGFKSKGISSFRFSLWLGLSALLGAAIGAKIAVDIDAELFNKLLALIMLIVVIFIVFNPNKGIIETVERMDKKHQALSIFLFFFIGLWGGFIQVGVGFLVIAVLSTVNRFSLVKSNSVKVFVILIYTVAALGVFIWEGKINWGYGLVLALGNSSGAWFASRWSVEKGDRWIKVFLIATVLVIAVKLWFFSE
ncbi:putative membrane protein YfcA [Catalinimonas alkaloidigena]|uniref:sulfite exporter TauE/SafE family protein n=1 Tax=Catalinimonas alkaloidigena TaxID=1075417 RepID=UPI00240509B6|nr:sulfite exporter TauE/SafE family protein [Catalinimonas alkaloidigena]MDF9795301.1 putative membrane protein YfcA [Catalinimonas alkaloidigena]